MYEIVWDKKAISELNKLDPTISKRIVKNIKELNEKFSFKDIKKLRNSDDYRLRIGDYRIIFSIKDTRIVILKVGHRKNIYKYLYL